MPRADYSVGMAKKTADAAARNFLLSSPDERVQHQLAVTALAARNALLEALESARFEQGLTKADLAAMAGLDASSVRRLLTSKTANPTTENAFRLMAAMGIQLEATLPTGERIKLVDAGAVRGSKAKRAVPA
jgi:DNA-binding phage protein